MGLEYIADPIRFDAVGMDCNSFSTDGTMKCPICEAPMKEGEVNLKKSISNMLAFGWGSTNLVFKGTVDKKEVELMTAWDFSKAYYCKKCGASLIASDKGQS